jgi:hypothetical protein
MDMTRVEGQRWDFFGFWGMMFLKGEGAKGAERAKGAEGA